MRITELFGIDFPIIQAPLARVQGSALAIAVCRAGGLGSLPCAMLAPEVIRQEVAAIRGATDRPYNLNFFCHTPPTPDPVRDWQES
jgi:nitronate monooxygenase